MQILDHIEYYLGINRTTIALIVAFALVISLIIYQTETETYPREYKYKIYNYNRCFQTNEYTDSANYLLFKDSKNLNVKIPINNVQSIINK